LLLLLILWHLWYLNCLLLRLRLHVRLLLHLCLRLSSQQHPCRLGFSLEMREKLHGAGR
jgi:hypothetical protein